MILLYRFLQKSIILVFMLFSFFFISSKTILAVEENKTSDPQKILKGLIEGKFNRSHFLTFFNVKANIPSLLKQIPKENSPKKSIMTMTKDISLEIPNLLLNWGSGSQKARVFKNQKMTTFFSNLFYTIIQMAKEHQLSISLNTTDLFHGHIILLGKEKPNLIIIFHAQEYPYNLPFTHHKSKKAVSTHKELLKGKRLSYQTPSFKRRNFIWSLKENRLFNINTEIKGPFFDLIFPKGWKKNKELKNLALLANSVQDNLIGKSLGSLNFFPSQNIPPYWSP